MSTVAKSGKGVLDRGADAKLFPQFYTDTGGPWLLERAKKAPNFLIDQTLDAPADYIIDTVSTASTHFPWIYVLMILVAVVQFGGAILAPGNPSTRVHPQVAVGLVKKDTDGLILTVSEVEWPEEFINFGFYTDAMAAGVPPFGCCVTLGVGGDVKVTKLGENKCRFVEKGYVAPRRCGPCCFPCCCLCTCWGCVVKNVLNGQLKSREAQWKKKGYKMATSTEMEAPYKEPVERTTNKIKPTGQKDPGKCDSNSTQWPVCRGWELVSWCFGKNPANRPLSAVQGLGSPPLPRHRHRHPAQQGTTGQGAAEIKIGGKKHPMHVRALFGLVIDFFLDARHRDFFYRIFLVPLIYRRTHP
jgi:hypothetical protein